MCPDADSPDPAQDLKSASAPRSVRDGLGGSPGQRRQGRSERRLQGGRDANASGEAERGAGRESAPSRGPRMDTRTRTFSMQGDEWTATLVGSSGAPRSPDRGVRLLEVELGPSTAGPVGTGYVAATDLGNVPPGELERLATRLAAGRESPRPRGASRDQRRKRTGSASG